MCVCVCVCVCYILLFGLVWFGGFMAYQPL